MTEAEFRDLTDRGHDAYPTPDWAVQAAVQWIMNHRSVWFDRNLTFQPQILDAGAGDGRWGYYFIQQALTRLSDYRLEGVEIRDYAVHHEGIYDEWHIGDYLTFNPSARYDLIMGNPPFGKPVRNIAQRFLEHSFELLKPGGLVCFFLRSAFLHGSGRADSLYDPSHLRYLVPYAERPIFVGENSDSKTEYCLFVFQKEPTTFGALIEPHLRRPQNYRAMHLEREKYLPTVVAPTV